MDKAELLEKLVALKTRQQTSDRDVERDHKYADRLLLVFIDDPEIAAAFNAIERWYS